MVRINAYKTPQFIFAFIGIGLIVFSLTILNHNDSESSNNDVNSGQTQHLKVRPAVGTPGDTLDILQGTRTLQAQGGSNLQQPQTSDTLQPNAKTDTFSNPSLPE